MLRSLLLCSLLLAPPLFADTLSIPLGAQGDTRSPCPRTAKAAKPCCNASAWPTRTSRGRPAAHRALGLPRLLGIFRKRPGARQRSPSSAAESRATLEQGATVTLIYGHRGAKGEAPENTLASFQRCLEHGVNRCELDLHLSRRRTDGDPRPDPEAHHRPPRQGRRNTTRPPWSPTTRARAAPAGTADADPAAGGVVREVPVRALATGEERLARARTVTRIRELTERFGNRDKITVTSGSRTVLKALNELDPRAVARAGRRIRLARPAEGRPALWLCPARPELDPSAPRNACSGPSARGFTSRCGRSTNGGAPPRRLRRGQPDHRFFPVWPAPPLGNRSPASPPAGSGRRPESFKKRRLRPSNAATR